MRSDGTFHGPTPERQRRLGRHMHVTVIAVWRYLKFEYEALRESQKRLRVDLKVDDETFGDCVLPDRIRDCEEEGLERGRWRASRDLKLVYMFRVIKILTTPILDMHPRHRDPANLKGLTQDEVECISARQVYFRWCGWVESIAKRLGIELVDESSDCIRFPKE